MQLRVDRHTLLIIPESEQDIAFLEDTLALREDGDTIKFERVDDPSDNWIKFRIESYALFEEDKGPELKSTPRTLKSCRGISERFKDISSSSSNENTPFDHDEEITGDF